MKPRITILSLGGTIAGKGSPGKTQGYRPGQLDVPSLLQTAPEIENLAELAGEMLFAINSSDMDDGARCLLAARIGELAEADRADGFVIAHGTNTLEETAYFLHLVLKTEKPVVITGAMRPSTALSADGPMNLYQAVALAAGGQAAGKGVLTVFSDRIFSARDVQKVSPFAPDAFSSREFGCMGYLRDDQAYLYYESTRRHTVNTPFTVDRDTALPRVGVAFYASGADPDMLSRLLDTCDGVVIAGAGNGSVSGAWKQVLLDRAGEGKPVVAASRIGTGIVGPVIEMPPFVIPGDTLSPQKARLLLALAMTVTREPARIREMFSLY